MSAPTCSASMNAFVPEDAIVPRLLIKSAFVIPTPVSRTVNVPASLFGISLIYKSSPVSKTEEFVKLMYLALSRASLALEISSRRNISLLE
uniref:Uncharacterized protein n=1 Tax=Schistosoma japonicum TaxID=6182 RepID=Q5C1I7_SCHJA|nr:unknown [Schistosoma japonicum]